MRSSRTIPCKVLILNQLRTANVTLGSHNGRSTVLNIESVYAHIRTGKSIARGRYEYMRALQLRVVSLSSPLLRAFAFVHFPLFLLTLLTKSSYRIVCAYVAVLTPISRCHVFMLSMLGARGCVREVNTSPASNVPRNKSQPKSRKIPRENVQYVKCAFDASLLFPGLCGRVNADTRSLPVSCCIFNRV